MLPVAADVVCACIHAQTCVTLGVIDFSRKPCSYLAKVEWLSIPDGHLIYHYSQIALVSNYVNTF